MKNNGMTLIEVIIALAILGILSLMVLTFFSATIIGIIHFGDYTEDVFLNQDLIEEHISDDDSGTSGAVEFYFDGEGNNSITIPGDEIYEGEIGIFLPN
jgi:prepilin-type N-terminal cleavage/methylation domain-containing protein